MLGATARVEDSDLQKSLILAIRNDSAVDIAEVRYDSDSGIWRLEMQRFARSVTALPDGACVCFVVIFPSRPLARTRFSFVCVET